MTRFLVGAMVGGVVGILLFLFILWGLGGIVPGNRE